MLRVNQNIHHPQQPPDFPKTVHAFQKFGYWYVIISEIQLKITGQNNVPPTSEASRSTTFHSQSSTAGLKRQQLLVKFAMLKRPLVGVEARRGGYQLRCYLSHFTMAQNYQGRHQ
ncbi:hypothetical protein TNCV_3673891 [Trichonephila clavipes]|nr:hypothetical protein TNCV_3673891 [Trichonephila clavipes]